MSAAETMQELPETSEADIRRLVDMQKAAHIAEGPMTAERRIDLIDRTIALIVDNGDAMVDALMPISAIAVPKALWRLTLAALWAR